MKEADAMNPITEAWENRGEGVYVTKDGWEPPIYRRITFLEETKTPEGEPGPVIATVEGSGVRYTVDVLTLVAEPAGASALFDFIVADQDPVSWDDITKGWDNADIEWEGPELDDEEASEMLHKALQWLMVTEAVIEDSEDSYRVKPEIATCELCKQGPEDGEDLDTCDGCSRVLCTRDACLSTADSGQEGNFCRLCQAADAAQEILDAILEQWWKVTAVTGELTKREHERVGLSFLFTLPQETPIYVLGADFDKPRPIWAISPAVCPSCGDAEGFTIASHGCHCGRMVCGNCKVDDDGEPAPCAGLCKLCRGGKPVELRADQYLARIGSVDYPLGSLRLVTDFAETDLLLTLYASLTGDEIGDDADRDADILDVIMTCIDAPDEESAVKVLREAGWDAADDGEGRDEALLRYAQAFRRHHEGPVTLATLALADRDAVPGLDPANMAAAAGMRRAMARVAEEDRSKVSPETWRRLAEEAGEVIQRTGSGLFCAKCGTPAPKDFLATGGVFWEVTEDGVICPDCRANPNVGEPGSYRHTPTGFRKEQARRAKRRVVWKPSQEVWTAICWKAVQLSEDGKPVTPHDLARKIAEDAAGSVVRQHQEALQRGALADVPTQMLIEVAAEREPALAKELLELGERATPR